jgi:hypothetical protein
MIGCLGVAFVKEKEDKRSGENRTKNSWGAAACMPEVYAVHRSLSAQPMIRGWMWTLTSPRRFLYYYSYVKRFEGVSLKRVTSASLHLSALHR